MAGHGPVVFIQGSGEIVAAVVLGDKVVIIARGGAVLKVITFSDAGKPEFFSQVCRKSKAEAISSGGAGRRGQGF